MDIDKVCVPVGITLRVEKEIEHCICGQRCLLISRGNGVHRLNWAYAKYDGCNKCFWCILYKYKLMVPDINLKGNVDHDVIATEAHLL